MNCVCCRTCRRQFKERSGGVLNRTCLPSDVIAFVVFCRLRYRLTLRDLSGFLDRVPPRGVGAVYLGSVGCVVRRPVMAG